MANVTLDGLVIGDTITLGGVALPITRVVGPVQTVPDGTPGNVTQNTDQVITIYVNTIPGTQGEFQDTNAAQSAAIGDVHTQASLPSVNPPGGPLN